MAERKRIEIRVNFSVLYKDNGANVREEFTEKTVVIDDSVARAERTVVDSIENRETERYGDDLVSISILSVNTSVLANE